MEPHSSKTLRYDRELLLGGAKRNAVLEQWEVERYGADSYGNPDYVSVYGMGPDGWHARGIRLLGRTAVECTRDELGDAIGREIAAIAGPAMPAGGALVIDPFAGSGNTLYWILRHLPGARGLGFELDAEVFRLTPPPISEVVDVLAHRFERNRLLCAVQIYETVDPVSLADVKARFQWSASHLYRLNAPGENHGILLGTVGWVS